jgi:hypothetical protein
MNSSLTDDRPTHERTTGSPVFERGRVLLKHLAGVNGRSLPFEERLRVLEDASTRTEPILRALAEVYEDAPQPMSEHAREALTLARSLACTCARGYRIAAGDASTGPSTAGAGRRRAPLMLKAMRYFTDAMRASYNSYSRLPEGAWKDIHELYIHAEREGAASGAADPHSRVSVLELYCECLLLSLTDPYRLVPGELERIEALIRELRAPVTLSRERPETRPTCHFVVECDEDRPPRPLREDDQPAGSGTRILDAGALVDELRAISPLTSGWPDGDEGRHLAAKLAALWDDPPKRVFQRDAADGSVAICVGVKPIASFVAHETAVDGESEASALREGLTMPLRTLPEDESGQLIPIHEWAVINVSAGGVKVRRSASTAYPITIGEVVGVRAPGKVLWRIGVTRWVTGLPDGTTEFGVQFFANAVCAVWVRRAAPGSARALGLLVSDGEGESGELLLAPPGTFSDTAEYEIRGEDFRSRVRAAKLIEGNLRFELFRVSPC